MEALKIHELLLESNISIDFVELVLKRLHTLTYQVLDEDIFHLAFAIQKTENTIKNECNIQSIPKELICDAVDMVCGYFLFNKKQVGQLSDNFDLDSATSVAFGDTKITYSSNETNDQKLNTLLSYMMDKGKEQFSCYRKLKW